MAQATNTQSPVRDAASGEKDRRLALLVNQRFQLTFLVYVLGLSAATIVIFYFSNLYLFWKLRELGLSMGLPPNDVFFEFVSDQQTVMNYIFIVTTLLVFHVFLIVGLIISNRIAGPIQRICNHMLKVVKGKTSPAFHSRDHDYFPELASAYNELLKNPPKRGKPTRKRVA